MNSPAMGALMLLTITVAVIQALWPLFLLLGIAAVVIVLLRSNAGPATQTPPVAAQAAQARDVSPEERAKQAAARRRAAAETEARQTEQWLASTPAPAALLRQLVRSAHSETAPPPGPSRAQ
jgi:hypothetical protein